MGDTESGLPLCVHRAVLGRPLGTTVLLMCPADHLNFNFKQPIGASPSTITIEYTVKIQKLEDGNLSDI